ncbi:16S rRNA (uracil(1498)-N(3))-methyltransferase [Pigmentiphaga aceris]|uniref:Ribosomal RNA small subunit methyltransferase E n=1 Tax=Pigmentiphaga aceris TaxID=1940612 RepID=A0A5C0ASM5_9BURK|nr:16S rRNA (uracil(1498)-N(3))-methyltransferase [Pigmentiphaga aceris]QEI05228.1 16S rRNA (uracil(1498)-N(3))-methyltransferase [Pigmentiphaga aceris]
MSLPRFHVDLPLAPGAELFLPDAVAHHAGRALRLRDGDSVVLFDGRGGEYPAILSFEGKHAVVKLAEHDPREAELAGRISLVQGIASGDKMDWIIEKAVETGVHAVVPIAAERSVLKLTGDRLEKRLAHWRRIAQAACEQCGRNRVPEVFAPMTLAQWLTSDVGHGGAKVDDQVIRLLCHPGAEQALTARLQAQADLQDLVLVVGPEGGWSDEELKRAKAGGVEAVSFGPRVLRSETAGTAMIAASSAALGWL